MTGSDPERQSGPWTRADWLLAAALFAGTFLSRIPFRTSLLYAWDSVLYTRALEDFNAAEQRPHPPGHIFYVGLVKLVNTVIGDPNAALVWVSVFFAAAAAAAFYWLGRAMLGRPVGLLAALLLASSMSFWAYSEVAYPYTLMAFLSIVAAGLIYRTWEGRAAYVLPAALVLALAAGFRQELLLFLLPILIAGLWGMPRLRVLGAAILLVLGTAAWYVPAALLSGGFAVYREAASRQSSYVIDSASVFGRGLEALWSNSYTFARFMLLALTAAVAPLAFFLFYLAGRRQRWLRRDRRLLFLSLWALPAVIFFVFVHVGEFGYVFSLLPPVLLAAAWGTAFLARAIAERSQGDRPRRKIFAALAAALIAVNIALFLVPGLPFSANRLAGRDNILGARLEAIRKNFDPETTLIVTVFDYQQVSYYLPQYRSWNFDPALDSHPVTTVPGNIRQVVIFEEYVKPRDPGSWEQLTLPYGQVMYYSSPEGRRFINANWEKQEVSLEGI